MRFICTYLGHKKTFLDARLGIFATADPYIRIRFHCERCGELLEPARICDLTQKEIVDLERNVLERAVRR